MTNTSLVSGSSCSPPLERTWPDAAASLREGLDDTLTPMRLGIDGQLAKTGEGASPKFHDDPGNLV